MAYKWVLFFNKFGWWVAWLPRISQKLQKQNELPIVDLKNQDMRISFCKKVEME